MQEENSTIYYGSLEIQERNRLIQQNNEDTQSIISNSTKISSNNQIQRPSQNYEIMQFSDESLESKKKHEEGVKKLQIQKEARNIYIPTNDNEIKFRLRSFNQPICYFGENAADRRERLKDILTKRLLERGEVPNFILPANLQEQNIQKVIKREKQGPLKGPQKLKDLRLQIATYSLKEAAIRIEKQKIKKIRVDPLDEEELIDQEVAKVLNFDMSMCQFADSSIVTNGSFSRNDRFYSSCGASSECKIWSIPDCQLVTNMIGHISRVNHMDFHPQFQMNSNVTNNYGNNCIATGSSDNTVRLWNVDIQKEENVDSVVLQGHEDRINKVLFHSLGNSLFSCSHDNTWRMWDIETQQEVLKQIGHSKSVYSMSLHPDGSLLFTGDLGGTGMIWDLRSGRYIMPIIGHVKQILSSDFSPNGYHIATGSDDNTLRIWDLRRKSCLYIIPAHQKLISCIKYQPIQGKFLVSSSYDHTVKVWSTKDWSLAKILNLTDSKITSVSLTQDCNYIATTSQDRKWVLWKDLQ